MNAEPLRQLQAPITKRDTAQPGAARHVFRAVGTLHLPPQVEASVQRLAA